METWKWAMIFIIIPLIGLAIIYLRQPASGELSRDNLERIKRGKK